MYLALATHMYQQVCNVFAFTLQEKCLAYILHATFAKVTSCECDGHFHITMSIIIDAYSSGNDKGLANFVAIIR